MKISCLTATFGDLEKLKRCLRMFDRQTWADREWVVVTDRSKEEVFRWAASLRRPEIRAVAEEDGAELWRLRNAALDQARGDLIAQWDDDDLFHPELLRSQAEFLERERAEACFLQTHLHLFVEARQVWVHDWSRIPDRGHPGTVMWRRSVPLRYQAGRSRNGGHYPEDSVFQAGLVKRGAAAYLASRPWLYAYTFHGRNVTGEAHHRKVVADLGMSYDRLRAFLPSIQEGFPGLEAGPATLMAGSEGICRLS